MKLLPMLVTAYCLTTPTALGTHPAHGTIAVDPRVISMHSRVYVPGYGTGRALDTGSAIKGLHIDVWMSSCFAARQWGTRHKLVHVG